MQRVAADDPSRRARVEAAPDEERLVLRLLLIDAVRVRVRVRPYLEVVRVALELGREVLREDGQVRVALRVDLRSG